MIEDTIYELINEATPVEVIIAGDNGPRPEKPYLMIYVSPQASTQDVHRGTTSEDGEQSISALLLGRVQVQAYGPGAWGVCEALLLSLKREDMLNEAERVNVSWIETPTLQNIPTLMDDHTYETRAILEIDFNYVSDMIDQVGVIETVEGTATMEPGDTRPFSITVE